MIVIVTLLNNRPQETYKTSEIIAHFKNMEVVEYDMDFGTGAMRIVLNNQEEPIYYTAPNVGEILDRITPYVEQYDEQHPDAPMVYNWERPQETSWITSLLPLVISMVLLGLLWWFMMKRFANSMGDGGKQMNFGKAKIRNMADEKRKTTFADVAGADEEKEELREIVDFLKNPKKYNELGARIPKGVLLVGPPGTGKTLLARAVAGEAGVPFFSISGSDFVEMFVGVGASRVRDLFDQAKKNAPCIVFIDEIDAVGRQRGAGLGGGHDEREQTLNQMLVEMDGFGANEGVIMIAATNRPDVLDPALMRPGRFDRHVMVGAPDIKGREDILKVHARGKPLAPDVNLRTIAASTAGFTGADLENLLNEAALLAARKNSKAITMNEIEEATIKVVVGAEKKSRVMSEKEKNLTAYHEAGHAVVTYYCPTQDPVHQISIIPRGMAGGYTMSLPTEDKSYRSRSEMKEDIVVLLGGRVAEALILGDISTGASNDIQRATKTATNMVTKYGMSEKLGPMTYGSDNDEVFIGRDMGHVKNYSEETAAEIDEEVRSIINNAYHTTEELLKAHVDKLHEVARHLFLEEKMSGEQFAAIMEKKQEPLPEQAETEEPASTPSEEGEVQDSPEQNV
ncbi:MAG TPA: ATP-dependent zinc metalloprotease FtsH [Candidatus Gallacutalibacter stercoravium]|nr:ATP-dependent zinc metalloprotease FtsH [Candidatus Gallacutalibacter stercoravium]